MLRNDGNGYQINYELFYIKKMNSDLMQRKRTDFLCSFISESETEFKLNCKEVIKFESINHWV